MEKLQAMLAKKTGRNKKKTGYVLKNNDWLFSFWIPKNLKGNILEELAALFCVCESAVNDVIKKTKKKENKTNDA